MSIFLLTLFILVVLLLFSGYLVWRGPDPADRLVAVDFTTNLLTGIIIVVGVIEDADILLDIGIALAAFSFIGTVSIARYISEDKVF